MRKRFANALNLRLLVALIVLLLAVDNFAQASAKDLPTGNAKDLFLVQLENPEQVINSGFAYTIQLHRGNQPPVQVSHDEKFFSGDGIKVRLKSNFHGYAYIVLAQGSTGKRTVLFPISTKTGVKAGLREPVKREENIVTPDREYVIPEKGVIRFDANAGVERLLFIVSRHAIDMDAVLNRGRSISINRSSAEEIAHAGILIASDSTASSPDAATFVVNSDPSQTVFVEVALNHLSKSGSPPSASVASASPSVVPPTVPAAITHENEPSAATTGTTNTNTAKPPVELSTSTPEITTTTPPSGSSTPTGGVPYRIDVPGSSPPNRPGEIATTTAGAISPTAPPVVVDAINRPVTDKWAVIVALSKYRNSNMNLSAPAKDADRFAEFLTEHAGFAPSHVIQIYDKQATKENLLNVISGLGEKVRPDDLFVFYANCHGSAETETPGNFLLLYDYRGEDTMDNQLLMQDLSNFLKSRIRSQRLIAIVQACHSGYVKAGKVPSPESVSNDLQGVGRIIATACSGNESSWVYRRGGIFTSALIPNLKKYPKLKEALMHTQADVIKETACEPGPRQMHPIIKYDLWTGDDAVLMVKPTDPQP